MSAVGAAAAGLTTFGTGSLIDVSSGTIAYSHARGRATLLQRTNKDMASGVNTNCALQHNGGWMTDSQPVAQDSQGVMT